MAAPISRRTFLTTTGAAAAGALLPGATAYAWGHSNEGVRFTLDAEVLDGGVSRSRRSRSTPPGSARSTRPA